MLAEQDKTLVGIKMAIQMEIDGKEFYLKASQESGNPLGKELLKSLVVAEDIHLQRFVQIYDAIRSQKGWPMIIIPPRRGQELRTIFVRATAELGHTVRALATELDAIQTAMAMENKTYDYYTSQSKNATYDAERSFYDSVAAEERGHHQILLNYYEYLKDPAGWFVKKEHPSLDGG